MGLDDAKLDNCVTATFPMQKCCNASVSRSITVSYELLLNSTLDNESATDCCSMLKAWFQCHWLSDYPLGCKLLEDITGKVRVESFPNLVSGQDIDWLPAIQNSQ
jgi:hypothetical protein